MKLVFISISLLRFLARLYTPRKDAHKKEKAWIDTPLFPVSTSRSKHITLHSLNRFGHFNYPLGWPLGKNSTERKKVKSCAQFLDGGRWCGAISRIRFANSIPYVCTDESSERKRVRGKSPATPKNYYPVSVPLKYCGTLGNDTFFSSSSYLYYSHKTRFLDKAHWINILKYYF